MPQSRGGFRGAHAACPPYFLGFSSHLTGKRIFGTLIFLGEGPRPPFRPCAHFPEVLDLALQSYIRFTHSGLLISSWRLPVQRSDVPRVNIFHFFLYLYSKSLCITVKALYWINNFNIIYLNIHRVMQWSMAWGRGVCRDWLEKGLFGGVKVGNHCFNGWGPTLLWLVFGTFFFFFFFFSFKFLLQKIRSVT